MIGWDIGLEMFQVDFKYWINFDDRELKIVKLEKIVF